MHQSNNRLPDDIYSELRERLSYVNPIDLQAKIRKFRQLNFKTLSYVELQNAILDVLSVKNPTNQRLIAGVFINMRALKKDTKLFRIRKISPNNHFVPLQCLKTFQDVWNPPSDICSLGRINKNKESLLYVSPGNALVALKEMKIEDNQQFCLIVYKAKSEIKFPIIGAIPEFSILTQDEQLKLNLYHDFMCDEFTRVVGGGSEYLYRISEIIAKDYFDLPESVSDAWCYPSIVSRQDFNLCFKPSVAKEKLNFLYVLIARADFKNSSTKFSVKFVAEYSFAKNRFLYHHFGSERQKQLVPELY